jgi:hypothetical protein
MSTTGLRRAENQEIIPTEITTIGGQPRKESQLFVQALLKLTAAAGGMIKQPIPTICIILITSNLI